MGQDIKPLPKSKREWNRAIEFAKEIIMENFSRSKARAHALYRLQLAMKVPRAKK